MPGPTSRDLHIDQLLTNISIAYTNPAYIADAIFPILPVLKQSDLIPKFNQSDWFRDGALLRAPRTKSLGNAPGISTDSYFCPRYSFRSELADEERDNADSVWDLETSLTEYATDKILLKRELLFASNFFIPGVWTTAVGGTDFTQWSDYANSTPLADITNYNDAIESRIGREGNVFVMGKPVWNKLRWHPDVIETIKYTQRGVATLDLFQSLIDMPKVLVGRALFTTSIEGTAEASVVYQRIWGKHALLLYAPDRPSLRTPAAGYTFTWRRVPNSLLFMIRHRDEQAEIDIFEANGYFVHKQTGGAGSGQFLQNAVV